MWCLWLATPLLLTDDLLCLSPILQPYVTSTEDVPKFFLIMSLSTPCTPPPIYKIYMLAVEAHHKICKALKVIEMISSWNKKAEIM